MRIGATRFSSRARVPRVGRLPVPSAQSCLNTWVARFRIAPSAKRRSKQPAGRSPCSTTPWPGGRSNWLVRSERLTTGVSSCGFRSLTTGSKSRSMGLVRAPLLRGSLGRMDSGGPAFLAGPECRPQEMDRSATAGWLEACRCAWPDQPLSGTSDRSTVALEPKDFSKRRTPAARTSVEFPGPTRTLTMASLGSLTSM